MLASSEERPEEPPEELRLGDIEEAVVRSGLTWFNSFFSSDVLDHPIENWSGEHIPSVQSTCRIASPPTSVFLQRLQFCLWWFWWDKIWKVLASFPKLPTCAACGLYSSACACSLCGGLELWMGLDGSRFCALIINHMYIYSVFKIAIQYTHTYMYILICIHINIDIILLFYILDHIRYTLCIEWRFLCIYFLCSLSKGWRNSQSPLSPYNSQGVEYKEFWRFCRHGEGGETRTR